MPHADSIDKEIVDFHAGSTPDSCNRQPSGSSTSERGPSSHLGQHDGSNCNYNVKDDEAPASAAQVPASVTRWKTCHVL